MRSSGSVCFFSKYILPLQLRFLCVIAAWNWFFILLKNFIHRLPNSSGGPSGYSSTYFYAVRLRELRGQLRPCDCEPWHRNLQHSLWRGWPKKKKFKNIQIETGGLLYKALFILSWKELRVFHQKHFFLHSNSSCHFYHRGAERFDPPSNPAGDHLRETRF